MVRKALLIGLNYKDSRCPLDGCWNDVTNASKVISERGYQVRVITDESSKVTRQTIIDAIRSLVEGAKYGDWFYFHFSGHGGQIPDENHEELDGKDETIYDSNLETISDDVLFEELVTPLPEGTSLTSVLDCCHSGTGLDLPYIYMAGGTVVANRKKVRCNAKLLSACADPQTAADTSFSSMPQGAMTRYFLDALSEGGSGLTWKGLITRIRISMTKGRFSQYPQLSYSVPGTEKAGIHL